MQLGELKPKQPGEFIRAPEWNALLAALQAEPGAYGVREPLSRRWINVFNDTGADIPAYSVFGITDDAVGSTSGDDVPDDPPLLACAQIGPLGYGSIFLPLTNGSELIPDGGYGVAHVISADNPTRLRHTSDKIPRIGYPCGVAMDSMTVEDTRCGFVCVGTSPEITDLTCVDVIRDISAGALIGEVTTQISARDGDELGSGSIRIKLRGFAYAPMLIDHHYSDSLEMVVYSLAESVFEVGDLVHVVPTAGVGYVVDCCVEGSSSDSESESESPSSAGPCGICPDGSSECYRIDISGVVSRPGRGTCSPAWNQSWWVKFHSSDPASCEWIRGPNSDNWPCTDFALTAASAKIIFTISQYGPPEDKKVLLRARIYEFAVGVADGFVDCDAIVEYETENFDCMFSSVTLETSGDNQRSNWDAATVTVSPDTCHDVPDDGGGSEGDEPEPDPPDPMDCTRCDATPQTLTVKAVGIVGPGACDPADLNNVEFELPAKFEGDGCEWELIDIEDGPCDVIAVKVSIDPFKFYGTYTFAGGFVVNWKQDATGTHDCDAGRTLVYDSEYIPPADFTASTLLINGG